MSSNRRVVKRKVKKKKRIQLSHVLAIAFVMYFGYTFFNQQVKINKYNSQIDMYNKEIEAKQSLVEYYNAQNENIESDEYKESVAREKLGLVKPYETMYVDSSNQ